MVGGWVGEDIIALKRTPIRNTKEMQKSEEVKLTRRLCGCVFPSSCLNFPIKQSCLVSLKRTGRPTFPITLQRYCTRLLIQENKQIIEIKTTS